MLSQHLFLLGEFVRRDFKGRYAGSVLGLLWSFAQPLWMLVLFTFIFSTVMKITPLGQRTESFGVFLFCGLLPWTAFHEGVMRAATVITDNSALVKKVSFPSELLVFGVVLAALLHQAIALSVFLVVLAVLGELSLGSLPLLLVVVPLQVALTLGLGLILGAVNVFLRDTAQVVGMVLTAWFYLTPIVYPPEQLPPAYRGWIALNPLTPVVGLFREALLGGNLAAVPGTGALVALAAFLLGFGLWLFRRLKPAFADEI